MPELVIIFGPPAVGKMTVGHALCQKTGFKLFHNHMTIEPLLGIFDYGTPQFRTLVNEFRTRIFQEAAKSKIPGLVFTFVWAFDDIRDKEYVDRLSAIFEAEGSRPVFVELKADLEQRLARNRHPERLAAKNSKRDTDASEARLLQNEKQHRFNSNGDFFYPERHLCIDNSQLSPEEVAEQVIRHFSAHWGAVK